jgi:predicted flap endonuclease-1-like 5' DNA nuclease
VVESDEWPLERSKPDNFKLIAGMDPRISSVLNQAGITTILQLAFTNQKQLEQIISEAGIALANSSLLKEQALLAAAGEWDRLANLHNKLKSGQRV